MLFTEDWMPDTSTHRWSYYAAKMRSAIALSEHRDDMEFSGYIVVGSSSAAPGAPPGHLPGGLLQRPLTLVGSGAKLVRYYNFGPSYGFPGNSYSDAANFSTLVAEMAEANDMIAKAEQVLWPARRPAAQVAILFPRSSELWDMWHMGSKLPTCWG